MRARRCSPPSATSRQLEVRSLYDLYPDFDIDVPAEQAALERAQLVVWLHPLYWYTAPGMMKHWFDVVLLGGWAHGDGGERLEGQGLPLGHDHGRRREIRACTRAHGHPFEAFAPVVEQTARYCGMNWLDPFVVHDSHELTDEALRRVGPEAALAARGLARRPCTSCVKR